MTKSEYMQALQKKMEKFNRELQTEIVEDYEQHFAEGLAAGRTEDEIIEELGNIEDMISELPEKDIKQEISVPQGADTGKDTYAASYNAVVIDGLVADVRVQDSTDGKITVEYHNEGDEAQKKLYMFYQYEDNGVLHLGVKRNDNAVYTRRAKRAVKVMLLGRSYEFNLGNGMDGNDSEISLVVGIPVGMPKVEVSTGSGNLEVESINVVRLNAHTRSGEMLIRDVKAEWMDVKTGSGDLEGVQLTADELRIQTGSGDLNISKIKAGSMACQTGSGDIDVNEISGKKVVVQCGSGDIELDGDFEEYIVRTGSGDVEMRVGSRAKAVVVETGSGDMDIDLGKVKDPSIKAHTGSGECYVYSVDGTRKKVPSRYTVGNGECQVEIHTGSGDAEVRCY